MFWANTVPWITKADPQSGHGWEPYAHERAEIAGTIARLGLTSRLIGWRLVRAVWGQGLASEAARLVLDHAWQVMRLRQVVSFTALGNQPSRRVMERIGLTQRAQFDHPRIAAGHPLCAHVLYAAEAP